MRILTWLLRGADSAETAARNPGLPEGVVRRMVELISAPEASEALPPRAG
ncbi:hypothetical protein ACWEGX_11510 [Streptomyces chartreusis]|nr:hypothetical protein [Streptomyces sp. WAC 01325]